MLYGNATVGAKISASDGGCLRQAYFKYGFSKRRMRNGVRVDPLQKRLCISRIQITRELLIKIELYLVMNHDAKLRARGATYTKVDDPGFTCLSLQTRWARTGQAGIYSDSKSLIKETK